MLKDTIGLTRRGVHKIGTGRERIIEEINETPVIRNPILLKR